jgi:hypothetical protein
MNWIMNDWIRFCSPLKTKEYLAMGKPVVSVPIPEVVDNLGDVISVASSPGEFVLKIEEELETDSSDKVQARIEKVAGESWRNKAEQISEIICHHLRDSAHGR